MATCLQEVTIPPPSLQDKKPDVIPGEERKETVDAAIVRIMKARKRLGHAELIQEVLQQIKFFRPDPRLIKSRIDALMGEYIRREDAMSLASPYVYVMYPLCPFPAHCNFNDRLSLVLNRYMAGEE